MALPTQQEFEANLTNTTPLAVQESDECPICMNDFTNPVRTPCNHDFCNACLLQALQRTNTCPHCRRMLFQARPFDPEGNQRDVGRQRNRNEEVEEGELEEEEEEIPEFEEEMSDESDDSDIRASYPQAGDREAERNAHWARAGIADVLVPFAIDREERNDPRDWAVGSMERDEPEWTNDQVGHAVAEGQSGVAEEEPVEEDRR